MSVGGLWGDTLVRGGIVGVGVVVGVEWRGESVLVLLPVLMSTMMLVMKGRRLVDRPLYSHRQLPPPAPTRQDISTVWPGWTRLATVQARAQEAVGMLAGVHV